MIFELVEDYADALAAIPAAHPRHGIIRLLGKAIRRDAHFIDRHPTLVFQCMWNTCWWCDSPAAAKHYEIAGQAVPPWQEEGAKLHRLVESWQIQKSVHTSGYPWLRAVRPLPIHLGSPQLAVLVGHQSGVTSVAFCPEEDRIVSGSLDRTVRVWDVSSSKEVAVLRGHEDYVFSVAVSPRGDRIASACQYNTVRVWDAYTGATLAVLSQHQPGPGLFQRGVSSICYSNDGRQIICGWADGAVRVFDADSLNQLTVLRGHKDRVRSVSPSPNGSTIASGSDDGTIRVWQIGGGNELAVLQGHGGSVSSVCYSPDGKMIASGSADGAIRVWDADSGNQLAVLCRE